MKKYNSHALHDKVCQHTPETWLTSWCWVTWPTCLDQWLEKNLITFSVRVSNAKKFESVVQQKITIIETVQQQVKERIEGDISKEKNL